MNTTGIKRVIRKMRNKQWRGLTPEQVDSLEQTHNLALFNESRTLLERAGVEEARRRFG